MSDALSVAELAEHYVELLPPRTLLSVLRAGTDGAAGTPGQAGTHGAHGASVSGTSNGQNVSDNTMWALFRYALSGTGEASGKPS